MVSVEYPGYGLYSGATDHIKMIEDSELVYDYLVNDLKISPSNIVVLGRSIGTGPAVHLASVRKPAALILISPYTSLKDVLGHRLGKFGYHLMKEKFANVEKINKTECPVLFIHGQKDKIIPHAHSEKLKEQCVSESYSAYPELMEHKYLDLEKYAIPHMREFFEKIKFRLSIDEKEKDVIEKFVMPEELLKIPSWASVIGNRNAYHKIRDKISSFLQNNNATMD